MHDYSNPNENILFAALENSLDAGQGNIFTTHGSQPSFEEDDVVGKYIHVPAQSYLYVKEQKLAVGTGDFTMDFWGYSIGLYCSVSNHTSGGDLGYTIGVSSSLVGLGVGDTNNPSSFIPIENKPNEWAHYALVRKDGKIYTFTNGKLIQTADINYNFDSIELAINAGVSNNPALYCSSANKYKAVRVCDFARWTADFTPPDPKGTGGQPSDPTELNLHILLDVNETVDLTGYIHPIAPNVPQLVWSSANAAVASVDQEGKVTGNAVGITKVHVKTPDDSWSAFVRIIVEEEGVNDLRLSILLEPGETARLKALFQPNGTNKPVVWSSSNTAAATVASNGKVSAVAVGETIITVQTVDGSLSDYIYVTVIADKN